ncbi:MAG: Gfo/Idh/MocA family oxidoreductase [Candidatus Bathyarchaeota archaeon]|nr:Gfo/Idh/MocA family oxidoreductase [Candidatus Bathyarchaeota archaeon]
MVKKVRVGFVGCGGITVRHLEGLVKNPFANLVAFCDIDLDRVKAVAKQYGTTNAMVFDDAGKMFEAVDLDAVYFCLPPFAHGAEFEAIEHNVPFFVEKPLNLHLDQAKEIASAVERKRVLTSVGYMNRYREGVKKVKGLFKKDPPILVLGGWIIKTQKADSESTIWTWWIIKEKSGGQFHEQVTHTVDLTRFLCSEIAEVHAFPAKGLNKEALPNSNIEDALVVNLKFVNGAVGNLWASCSADGGGGGVSLNMYANKTTALFSGWNHSLRLLQVNMEQEEFPGEPNIFEIEDNAFIDAIRLNDPSKILCPYTDGVKTLEVTLAANESMNSGKPIKIHPE